MRRTWEVIACGLLAGFLVGCEGTFTGSEIAREPLPVGDGGAYAPLKFSLTPDMNPVAFNFRADFTQDPAEFGKWNAYRATLARNGDVIAARTFNVNHPASRNSDSAAPPTQVVQTLFIVDLPGAGEYELAIAAVGPLAIALRDAQIDVRRNVRRPQQ